MQRIVVFPLHDNDAAGCIAFGGNGGGELLLFAASGAVYILPVIGMTPENAIPIAGNFQELTQRFNFE